MDPMEWEQLEKLDCDYVMFGDGSGVRGPGGWAVVIYEPAVQKATTLVGSTASATNNTMELSCYIEALAHLRREGVEKKSVVIFSDSTYVVNCGNGEWRRKKNRHLWVAFEELCTTFNVTFMHRKRNSLPPLKWADCHAGRVRKALESRLEELTPPSSPEPRPDDWI